MCDFRAGRATSDGEPAEVVRSVNVQTKRCHVLSSSSSSSSFDTSLDDSQQRAINPSLGHNYANRHQFHPRRQGRIHNLDRPPFPSDYAYIGSSFPEHPDRPNAALNAL